MTRKIFGIGTPLRDLQTQNTTSSRFCILSEPNLNLAVHTVLTAIFSFVPEAFHRAVAGKKTIGIFVYIDRIH